MKTKRTRVSYWSVWRKVLKFGAAHRTMDRHLPMLLKELKALIMGFMMLGMSTGNIKTSCVQ